MFLKYIVLRFYVWKHSVKIMGSTSRHAIGGFFYNPFRFIDSSIVAIDLTLCVFELVALSSNNSEATKSVLKVSEIIYNRHIYII
jgi:fatty acid-binding protein DegV